jgi:hypothetical protein
MKSNLYDAATSSGLNTTGSRRGSRTNGMSSTMAGDGDGDGNAAAVK